MGSVDAKLEDYRVRAEVIHSNRDARRADNSRGARLCVVERVLSDPSRIVDGRERAT